MPQPDSLDILDWPDLYERLLGECLTPYGIRAWDEQPFLPDSEAMTRHQAEVEGLKTLILRYGDVFSDSGLPDVEPAINRLSKAGLLNLNELRQLMRTIVQGGRLIRHFSRNLKSEPTLQELLLSLLNDSLIPQAVLDLLGHYLDTDGELLDEASPELSRLRHRLRQQKQALQHGIQRFLSHSETAQMLQSTAVTERDGRAVFPIKVEHKNKLPGVIHGASGSGATVFLEPDSLVRLNNELQGLHADLEQEVERLLKQVSVALHPYADALHLFIQTLGQLDRRLAAARFSRLLKANPVHIRDTRQQIDLRQARHPLLVLQQHQQTLAHAVVANDVRIGLDDIRTLVITGPNTGGKTVLLKMLGLFALMLRAGLHLPVDEQSSMSCFSLVLADIGDQQSISQSLSTFSAHLNRLKSFLDDETTLSSALVLIDEIAAGTDPAEGAALAKAVLDELYQKGALTVVSTHLGELKLDAHQHAGFMNASVEFDPETLSPTYRLMLGVPGASNAITIAQKLGLKDSVIVKARANLSAPARESSELLQELEIKNRQLEEELQRARSYRLEAQEAWEKVEYERQRLETEKRDTLKRFQTGLKGRIHGLEEQVKTLRKALQNESATPEQLARMAHKLKKAGRKADDVFYNAREHLSEAPRLNIQDLRLGDSVFSRQLELTGEIIALQPDSNEVVLQAGIMRVTVPVNDLQRPYRPGKRPTSAAPSKAKKLDRPGKIAEGESILDEPLDPSLSCDVRGQRADEALLAVEEFLDEAILSGYSAVAVIHGLGTGALKREIRHYLGQSAYVKRFYPAQATQGGDGKTIIELQG